MAMRFLTFVLPLCAVFADDAVNAPSQSEANCSKFQQIGKQRAGEDCCVTTHGSRDPHLNNCGGSRPVGLQFATRSPVMSGNGMAATSQPLSTVAAIDILKAGGNAVDAGMWQSRAQSSLLIHHSTTNITASFM